MKTAAELKRFFKDTFGISVRVNTSSGKARWQRAWIEPDNTGDFHAPLVYSQSIPEDFRRLCIKTVYPTTPSLHAQASAGNVGPYGIAMVPSEWESAIATYTLQREAASFAESNREALAQLG